MSIFLLEKVSSDLKKTDCKIKTRIVLKSLMNTFIALFRI